MKTGVATMNSTHQKWAILLSHHLSGYSLAKSIRTAGWPGNIVNIKINHAGPSICECVPKICSVVTVNFEQPHALLDFLGDHFPNSDQKYVCFFDERFHQVFHNAAEKMKTDNVVFKIGSTVRLKEILDRYRFYSAIAQHSLAIVPKTVNSSHDPWRLFGGPFFFRFKETWNGMKRNPRNRPIYSQDQLEKLECDLLQKGFKRREWCYQELLSVRDKDNVSICGWHGPDKRYYIATRKVLQHPPENGNGDVVVNIDPPEGLLESTHRILDAFDYDGPFEMEYVYESRSEQFKVIELNPRFWLQHGLVEHLSGNLLARHYLNIEKEVVPRQCSRYWVNFYYAVYRLLKLDLRVLRYLFNRPLTIPSFKVTFKWLWCKFISQLMPSKTII